VCVFCRSVFVLFILAIALSVLLRLADSDYAFQLKPAMARYYRDVT
jgi:hypothetical protein